MPWQTKPRYDANGSLIKDVFTPIFAGMLESEAFIALPGSAWKLYTVCAMQWRESKKPIPTDNLSFTMNQEKWQNKYQLYGTNKRGFYRDMDELISKGFIDCVYPGAMQRKKSIYRFSKRWQKYGTDEFTIPYDCMTQSMRNKMHE